MRILSRYFALRFLGLFFAILLISTLAIIVVEMLLNFEEMMGGSRGLSSMLSYLFLRIPAYYLRDLVPIAAFAAAFFSIGLAAYWYELTAVKAGGVSTAALLAPILLAALALSLATFLVNETLVIEATQGWNQRLRGGNQSISFRRGTFWYHRGRTIYNIASANREEQTLHGLTIYELDESGRLLRRVQAESADIHADPSWQLENATIRRFDPDRSDAPAQFERVAKTTVEMHEQSAAALLAADPGELSLADLQSYIGERASEGDEVDRERALLHARLAEPVTVVVLCLLALPLGLRVERDRSLGPAAVYAVATVAAFFAVKSTTITLAVEAVIPSAVGVWTPLAIFAGLGSWQTWRESR